MPMAFKTRLKIALVSEGFHNTDEFGQKIGIHWLMNGKSEIFLNEWEFG